MILVDIGNGISLIPFNLSAKQILAPEKLVLDASGIPLNDVGTTAAAFNICIPQFL
jgi:hypothetical protein